MCIHMDGYKEVSLSIIGYFCPFPKIHSNILLPGINYLYIRHIFFNVAAYFECNGKSQVFLFGDLFHRLARWIGEEETMIGALLLIDPAQATALSEELKVVAMNSIVITSSAQTNVIPNT